MNWQWDDPVCATCFEDDDLVQYVTDSNGDPGCSFGGCHDTPTAPLGDIARHVRSCLSEFYGFAADQLPYESAEGGYQGRHWYTYELLLDVVGIELPRDIDGRLLAGLSDLVGQDIWCDYDWLALDLDESLASAWKALCETIRHERRFFFAAPVAAPANEDEPLPPHPDDYTPLTLLAEVVTLLQEYDLLTIIPKGEVLYRCRPCEPDEAFVTAADLGPPPADAATQANRMNPPGIPMMYASETRQLAVVETQSNRVSVGRFELLRDACLVDLADLPAIPGLFSGVDRRRRLGLVFIHGFVRAITEPVDRTDRIHIDYIPSQVVTEYIRHSDIAGYRVDGIRYPSSLQPDGRNVVLFAAREDLLEPDGNAVHQPRFRSASPWIRLVDSCVVDIQI